MRMRGGQSGFTLIEAVVAAALVATAVAGMAPLLVQGGRAAADERRAPVALAAAAAKLEQLLALTWTYDAAGTPIGDLTSDTSAEPPAPVGGTGLSPSPPDSLTRSVSGYVDYLDPAGRSVGSVPAAGAVYARRWRVRPGGMDGMLDLRVCVLRLPEGHGPPEVCLATARGRR